MFEKIKIEKRSYHRNGISGTGFDVILFEDNKRKMIGIVFPDSGNVAVFNRELLAKDIIEFGKNSWRGDHYEEKLRAALGQL